MTSGLNKKCICLLCKQVLEETILNCCTCLICSHEYLSEISTPMNCPSAKLSNKQADSDPYNLDPDTVVPYNINVFKSNQ